MLDSLTWTPAWRIRELIGAREISPVEVVDHFLARIEQLAPKLQAFSYVDHAGAREEARQAEKAVLRGDELGNLHGIPLAVKEHIAVAGMPRCPLRSTVKTEAPLDDIAIGRLRQAGAIVLGTTTQMGSGIRGLPAEGSATTSHDYKWDEADFNWDVEARNPWDVSRAPGWSSSGSAAAASAALVPFAIGSDGGGSTRLPAAFSGVVGVHTTGGLIPEIDYEAPMDPIGSPAAPLAATRGPLARSVRDCAIVAQVMAGPDGRDPLCLPFEPPSFLDHLDDGVDGWRFAWTDDFGYASIWATDESPRVIAHVRQAAQGLSRLGATVQATDETWENPNPHLFFTSAAYNPPAPGVQKPSPELLRSALELRGRNDAKFRRVLSEHTLLLSPTSQRIAPPIEEWAAAWLPTNERRGWYTSHTFMFNWLKYPAVSVPCGFVDGMPVGLQIVGLPGSEDRILRAAQAFQRAFPQDERPAAS